MNSHTPQPAGAVVSLAKAKATLCLLFLVLLWLPLIGLVLNLDRGATFDENRAAAPLPQFRSSLAGAQEFLSGFERYYADHFGFRSRLIGVAKRIRREWLRETVQSKVIIGQKGWLFYSSPGDQRVHLPHLNQPFTPGELRDWAEVIDSRDHWLKQRGIQYLVVIPPDKESVYPEYLPAGMPTSGRDAKIAQFLTFVRRNSSGRVLHLREPLRHAKGTAQLYHKTDSHWNDYGAFVATHEITSVLKRAIADLPSLSLNQFSLTTSSKQGGNLARLLEGQEVIREHSMPALIPKWPLEELQIQLSRPMPGVEIRRSRNARASGKCVIFGDSFSEALMPFLGQAFGEVVFCRLYESVSEETKNVFAHIWDKQLIEREVPTVVIDEILESFLAVEDPAFLLQHDRLK